MQVDTHQHIYDSAHSLHIEGSHDEAVSCLLAAIDRDETAGKLWELLGIIEFSRGKTLAALSALEHASLYYAPLSIKAQIVLAVCYLEKGFRGAAQVIYTHVDDMEEIGTEYLEQLAWGLTQVGEHERALAIYRREAQRLPESEDMLKGAIQCLRKLHRPAEEILPYALRRHRLDPNGIDSRIQLAWMFFECGRSQEGSVLLDAVSIQQIHCIRCLTLMQMVFQSAGDEGGALACRIQLEIVAGNKRIRQQGGESC